MLQKQVKVKRWTDSLQPIVRSTYDTRGTGDGSENCASAQDERSYGMYVVHFAPVRYFSALATTYPVTTTLGA